MKKTYKTPLVYFENFELSSAIASCEDFEIGKTNNADRFTCGIKPEGARGFIFANVMCQYEPQDLDLNAFCYHTMNADLLFTS